MSSTSVIKFVLPICFLAVAGCGGGGNSDGDDRWVVTPTASDGGSISPSSPQKVDIGTSVIFQISPDDGYQIVSVTGCDGTLAETSYTTAAFNMDCTVSVVFGLKENNDNGSVLIWNGGDWNEEKWN